MDNSVYLIAGNDEHGLLPTPTPGKRTPIMPNVNRSFYENEFNREAKRYFLEACKRQGFRTYDVKPSDYDVPLEERAKRVNEAKPNLLVTFAYNAYGLEYDFSSPEGFEVFYSTLNKYPTASAFLGQNIINYLKLGTGQVNRGLKEANFYMLREVNCPSVLVESGFMSNFKEAKLMMDPDFQREVGEEACRGVCDYLNVPYVSGGDFSYPLLWKGSRGEEVRYLQYKLLSKLYNVGMVDGQFNDATRNALIQFQKNNGLVADGIVGPKTWYALRKDGGFIFPLLKIGSKGRMVEYLQYRLKTKGFYQGELDGNFGSTTSNAVKRFQGSVGLTPDGIVGYKTWNAINK